MQNVLLVVHLIIALALIAMILMQRSEGGALGIGGGGASGGNLFSARGVGNTLTRATAILAVAFFCTSIALTLLATRSGPSGSVFDNAPAQQGDAAPAQQNEGTGGSVLPQIGQEKPADPAVPQVPTNN
jgi:preprotein translocase subunit SecG